MDLATAAARIGCDVRALRALIAVECSGPGIVAGRPVIRVEAHLLWLAVRPEDQDRVSALWHVAGPKPWEGHTYLGRPYHGDQAREWTCYEAARQIDPVAAVEATSWGMGQVLGKHWKNLGYSQIAEFVAAQYSPDGQLDTIARYAVWSGCARSLREHDWREVAERWNGPGNIDRYSLLLERAYGRAT